MSANHFIPNSYQTPNALVDMLMPLLTCEEWCVLSYAVRHILGFQDRISSRQHRMSVSSFEKGYSTYPGCGLSRPTIMKALDALHKFRILKKIGEPTQDGQLLEVAFDEQAVDMDGLRARQDEKKHKATAHMQTAREKRLTPLTSGKQHLPAVNSVDHQRSMALTTSGKQHLPNQTQSSNTTSNPEEKDSTVSVEPVAAITPTDSVIRENRNTKKRKAKSEDTEANIAIGALIKAWVDATKTLEANPYKKKGYRADAKMMHAAGITPADVTAFVEWKRRTDKFYADKTVKFGVVAADIGQYKAKHAPSPVPGARKKTAAELPLFSEEYWEAYNEEQRELREARAAREEAKRNVA